MAEKLGLLNRHSAHWRKIDSKQIVMTVLHQCFTHSSGEETIIKHICPWGMRDTMAKLFTDSKCLNKNILPAVVKEEHPMITGEHYVKSDWKVTVMNTGPCKVEKYHRLYCSHCQPHLVPALIKEYTEGLGQSKTVEALVNNWDSLKIPPRYIDYIGCFLPWESDINAGPNSRRFIREQSEHPKTTHIYTVDSSSSTSNKVKRQSTLLLSGAAAAPSQKVVVLDDELPSGGPNPKQSTFSAKQTKKHMKQGDLSNYLGLIPLFGECSKTTQIQAKSYCLYIVHKGVQKALSHTAILENYESGYQGQLLFRKDSMAHLSKYFPAATIPGVVKVQLNEHNINDAERVILDTYRYDEEDSLYRKLDKSPFYSIMHDGISKFSTEYNGVVLPGIDKDHAPIHVPFCLTKMKGGVTGVDTAEELMNNVATISGVTTTAYDEVIRSFEDENTDDPNYVAPIPPKYFKIGTLLERDSESKVIKIEVHAKFPVGNTGDGVAVNVKAARVLRDLYGFMSPDFRCTAHSASGTIKRLTTSKTMNVAEVTTCYETLRTVIKHFESSVKNKEILDTAMEILEMTPLHLLSWCQTRMAHFLKSCSVFDDMLATVYDTMYTRGIRVDERDQLFTAITVFIIKIMADLYPQFDKGFLRKADMSNLLVSEVYNLSDSFAKSMEDDFTTPSADAFHDSLHFDDNGNLIGTTKADDKEHSMLLNHPHKPTRGVSEAARLQKVKDELDDVKTRITSNVVENVRDQCDGDTFYYCWSALDLSLKLSPQQRKDRISDVVTLFCTKKVHIVQKYTNKQETDTTDNTWEDHKVELQFPAKISVTKEELFEEFDSAIKTVNGLYIEEVNLARMQKRTIKQLNVWQKFLTGHYMEFPAFSQLVQILLTTAGNTSPVERSYTYLEMITSKRRNRILPRHLETLFLLTSLQIPVKEPDSYTKEVARCNRTPK